MARQAMVILLLSGGLALATFAQEQESSPPRPSVINSTYEVTIPIGTVTVHLREEDGQLKMHEKYPKGAAISESVEYEMVNYVGVERD